jgi:chromate reductase, NAD(P)H dehydrogenase (quinone)
MDDVPVHVLGFAGSLRRGSYNAGLLRAAGELLPVGMTLEIFDLASIPFYNADVQAAGFPPPVVDFKARIAAADALLIATPEYNFSFPGVLKNAIDWASRPPQDSPLDGKPGAIMGASSGALATVRAQMALRQVCVYTNILLLNRPEVRVARAAEKFDAQGRLIDERTRQELTALLATLLGWTRRLRE